MASLPSHLKRREVSIERGSHPSRFQSQWLIAAYEKIIPSSALWSPSLALPTRSTSESTGPANIKEKHHE